MILDVDLSALSRAAARMGTYAPDFALEESLPELGEIEIFREAIDLDQVQFDGGLIVHHGSPVRLYIDDHGRGFEAALSERGKRRKFHVAECKTLQNMREKGRFDRYIVTNDLRNELEFSGQCRDGTSGNAHVELDVCKNCLTRLNYDGAAQTNPAGREVIAERFTMDEFLETYSTLFRNLPKRRIISKGYTADWKQVSRRVRDERGYLCEFCEIDLSGDRSLCHVHHRNGVKDDNTSSNLAVLCADCHRKQPDHAQMHVRREHMERIRALRIAVKRQHHGQWEDAYRLVDAAARDMLDFLRAQQLPVPVIGHDVGANSGVIGRLEFAWPDAKVGVALHAEDGRAVAKAGWTVFDMFDLPERYRDLAAALAA